MCESRNIVVDATGHVAGKLAANIAKKLLEGYYVTVVACENAVFTGPLKRHIGKYKDWKLKRCVVNPQKGAFHYKEPSKYFYKILRTMVQRKTNRGGSALRRLQCFESIPVELLGCERVLFPQALLKVTADPERKHTLIGTLLSQFGWKHQKLSTEINEGFYKKEAELMAVLEQKKKETKDLTETAEFQKKIEATMASLK